MVQSFGLTPMPRPSLGLPQVNDVTCHLCRRCLAASTCRGQAFIRFGRDEAPYIDPAQCRGCLICMPACPFGAVELAS